MTFVWQAGIVGVTSSSGAGEARNAGKAYHSKSLYMMVKKTCRNRLTAFMSTAKRYNHASPDMLAVLLVGGVGLTRSCGGDE